MREFPGGQKRTAVFGSWSVFIPITHAPPPSEDALTSLLQAMTVKEVDNKRDCLCRRRRTGGHERGRRHAQRRGGVEVSTCQEPGSQVKARGRWWTGEEREGEMEEREEEWQLRSEVSSGPEVKVEEDLGWRQFTRTWQMESESDGYASTNSNQGKETSLRRIRKKSDEKIEYFQKDFV